MRWNKKYIGSVLVVFLLIICLYFFYQYLAEPSKDTYNYFPDESYTDSQGRKFSRSDLKNHYIYVQFTDLRLDYQKKLIDTVISLFDSSKLQMIAFVKNEAGSIKLMDSDIPRIHFIYEKYELYQDLFHAPHCCQTFHIYDKAGKMLRSGYVRANNQSDVLALLKKFINGTSISVEDYISPGMNIRDIEWFSQIERIKFRHSDQDHFVLCLLLNVCLSCPSGKLVLRLKELRAGHPEIMPIIILPQNYTQNDRDNLQANMELDFCVELADSLFQEQWDKYMLTHGQAVWNQVVMLINSDGLIENVMQSDCNCLNQFFASFDVVQEMKNQQ